MEQHIPIIMAFDENYAMPSNVAVYSALRSKAEDTKYAFYILVSKKLSQEAIDNFNKLIEWFPGTIIEFIEVGSKYDYALVDYHFTPECIYRLFIPEILPNMDRCIYLDGDSIVCDDLTALWETEIGDNYLAGIRIIHGKKRYRALKIPSADQYIGTGTLIMNLKIIKEGNLVPKFMELAGEGYMYPDMDILNKVCYNRIFFLPLKYSILLDEASNFNDLELRYPPDELEDALLNPVIIQYAGGRKPWSSHCDYALLSHIWYKAAVESPYGIDYTKQALIGRKNPDLKDGYHNFHMDRLKKSFEYRFGKIMLFLPRILMRCVRRVFPRKH